MIHLYHPPFCPRIGLSSNSGFELPWFDQKPPKPTPNVIHLNQTITESHQKGPPSLNHHSRHDPVFPCGSMSKSKTESSRNDPVLLPSPSARSGHRRATPKPSNCTRAEVSSEITTVTPAPASASHRLGQLKCIQNTSMIIC